MQSSSAISHRYSWVFYSTRPWCSVLFLHLCYKKQSDYGAVLTMAMGLGVIMVPFYGAVLDRRLTVRSACGSSAAAGRVATAAVPLSCSDEEAAGLRGLVQLSLGFGVAYSLSLAIMTSHAVACGPGGDGPLGDPGCPSKYPAFLMISYPLYMAFQTGVPIFLFELPARRFSHRSYGILTGSCLCAAGVLSLLEIPVLNVARGGRCPDDDDEGGCGPGSWESIMWAQTACLALLFAYPLWLRFRDLREDAPVSSL